VVGGTLRARLQRVVEVGRHNVIAELVCCHQQGAGIRTAGDRDNHSISGPEKARSTEADEQRM
jgi:hypothetical protein